MREHPEDTIEQLATRIPRRLHKAVRIAALEAGVTMREWVGDALAAHLREVTGRDAES